MQKILLALLVGSAIISPVVSHAEGSYVKFGMGESRYSGSPASKPTGYYLAYGMQLDPSVDIEVGVVDFGRANIGVGYEDIKGRVRTRTRSFYGAAVGSIPMSSAISLQGKLGLAVNRSSATNASENLIAQGYEDSSAKTNVHALIGAGLKMQFSKQVFGTLEYTRYGAAAHGHKLDMFNAALGYQF